MNHANLLSKFTEHGVQPQWSLSGGGICLSFVASAAIYVGICVSVSE